MEHNVLAEVEIEDTKIVYYTSITLRQKFNEHHTFAIRINHDVLETQRSFSLSKAQKLIGKPAIIRLKKIALSAEDAYEFRGIICEICMEQSNSFSGDLILKGYSPTILLENGPHLTSFYKKNLKQIADQVTKSVSASNCTVNINSKYKKQISYMCQYRESNFHFLNRLSSEFNEWFYYDGTDLHFGKPSSSKNIDITYGEDVGSIQLVLRILPMTFSNYSYNSKNDSVLNCDAPAQVDGLNEYASYVLKESNKVFSEKVNTPLRQRVESKSDLESFVKNQKAARAAELEVLTGTSDNPSVNIGAIANVKISKLEYREYKKEDYGNFVITSVEHHVGENGKYYNSFEAIPAGLEVIPVNNIVMPIAEPQVATVTDNKDPDNLGRVRVQMLWQQKVNQTTDWVRVMTSDAGSSDIVSKNRGFVFIPEIGDQVLLCFRYNDPDRPFVLGSIFHGKTAAGGGADNDKKTLSSRSGNTIELNDKKGEEKIVVSTNGGHIIELNDEKGKESIIVKDKNNNIIGIDTPGGKITVQDKNGNHIVIDSAKDSISISAKSSITLSAMNINLLAGATVNVKATAAYTLNTMNSLSNVLMSTVFNTKNMSQTVLQTLNSTATTINQIAKKDINQKAKEKITISAKNKLDQRAGEMDVSTNNGNLKLKASSDVEIKGTTVKTN